ncbi:DUF3977 family protein [Bacillus sp. JCM 19041]|uniref:DUF3977 family protein n=1 Tax=Bacillus sp. JCM 19041 TaxID=1460637 RepID=UPI0006D08295
MKYIELGFGNRWILRTEIEFPNGEEVEVRGVSGPIRFNSLYLRIWISKHVWIIDTVEGFKHTKKKSKNVKVLLGISSL